MENEKVNSGQAAIRLENVAIGYGGRPLFRPFSFEIEKGTFTVVIGANGSGKSTLLHTIGGTLAPVGGKVFIDGTDIRDLSGRQLARRLGLVYTERMAAGGLTVRELVEMGRHPYTGCLGRLSAKDRVQVDHAMNLTGIKEKSECFLSEISDGERQKAMVARAIDQETPIMILDEPTNFLDAASRIETLSLVRSLVRDNGMTVLLSTHDTGVALEMADNVLTVLPRDEVNPVSVDKLESEQAVRRLKTVFFDRGIVYDPERKDFVCLKAES